jgi:galactokinase
VPRERSAAFAPGRVNLIGEHTDYNEGLALPFAIAAGTTVRAERLQSADGEQRIEAYATDLGESDEFPLEHPLAARGWRAFVRGTADELRRAGYPLVGARVRFGGDVPRGAGLSSSAALEVALCLALLELGAEPGSPSPLERVERIDIARLCARVERDWVGAQTGLLDQLASLCGSEEQALCIDFRALSVEHVPLRLGGWQLVVLDSGERHAIASSGYNERREECARACRLLEIASLRDAEVEAVRGLPEPLRRRAAHVLSENLRVLETVQALRAGDLPAVGRLLDASHASLRDDYEVSTPAVEAAVARLRSAGASGARLVGGGFGGSVLGLFPPGRVPPAGTREVRPGPGARILED